MQTYNLLLYDDIAIEMTDNRLLQVAIYSLATLCVDAIKVQF